MLMNRGSIASLRRNVGLLDDDERPTQPHQQVPYEVPRAPMQAPPMAPPNERANLPHADESRIGHGFRKILGVDEVVPELASMLNPDQQKRVKPGLWTALGNWFLEGKGGREQQIDRAQEMLTLQDAGAARNESAALKSRREALLSSFGPMPTDSDGVNMRLRQIHQGLIGIGDFEKAAQMKDWIDDIQPKTPTASARDLTWRDNVVGADGKPYQVAFDRDGKEVSRVPQFQAPKAGEGMTEYQRWQMEVAKRRLALAERAEARMGSPAAVKPPPATVVREVLSHRTMLREIQKAKELLKKNPDAVGLVKGIGMHLPGAPTTRKALGATDAGNQTRNLLTDLSSIKVQERSGAAVPAAESWRYKGFAPEVSKDYEFNMRALEELEARAQEAIDTADEEFGGYWSKKTAPTGKPTGKTKTITVNGKTFTVPDDQ